MGGEPIKVATMRLLGLLKTSLGRSRLLKSSLRHHGYLVGHRHGFHLIMRDIDCRDAKLSVQAHQLRTHLSAQRGVEVGERLVHEKEFRPTEQRPSERDALALAAGQLARTTIKQFLQPQNLDDLRQGLLGRRLVLAPDAWAECQVAMDRHMGIECVALKHHSNVSIARRNIVDDTVIQSDRSGCGALQSGEHAQRCGFTAARGSQKDQELPVIDGESQVLHGDVRAERPPNFLQSHRSHIGPQT